MLNMKMKTPFREDRSSHLESQKDVGTVETAVAFDPAVCKRLKLKADFIPLPLSSVATLFK